MIMINQVIDCIREVQTLKINIITATDEALDSEIIARNSITYIKSSIKKQNNCDYNTKIAHYTQKISEKSNEIINLCNAIFPQLVEDHAWGNLERGKLSHLVYIGCYYKTGCIVPLLAQIHKEDNALLQQILKAPLPELSSEIKGYAVGYKPWHMICRDGSLELVQEILESHNIIEQSELLESINNEQTSKLLSEMNDEVRKYLQARYNNISITSDSTIRPPSQRDSSVIVTIPSHNSPATSHLLQCIRKPETCLEYCQSAAIISGIGMLITGMVLASYYINEYAMSAIHTENAHR
jgi:preprotein translocase subunit Sss1